jgi:hypothetical protein
MIQCSLRHLEARCRERGYTLDEVRPCIVAEDGDRITVDETHAAYPRPRQPGLGDMMAAGLASVGITKERVSRVLGRDCGCAKRQQRLNDLGRKLGIGGDARPPLPPER